MDEMPMPDGWTMSMMWMRMPGQSWAGTAASFLAMWTAMMVAMMLPSLVPGLWCHHGAMRRAGFTRANRFIVLVAVGYFVAWAAVGALVFPFGVALSELAFRQPALARVTPIAVGAAVLFAGLVQHTKWKARQLVLCREPSVRDHARSAESHAAWRYGVRLGLHCVGSCAGLTVAGLVVGAMDFRVMAVVTTAITAERLAPSEVRVARAIGDLVVVAGLALIARAVRLG
jgi:predicted metal-binding membrane protein